MPPLQAQLKTRAGKLVYSWTIAPPARSLPPGASASFNSAEVNVPPGGDELTITLGARPAELLEFDQTRRLDRPSVVTLLSWAGGAPAFGRSNRA